MIERIFNAIVYGLEHYFEGPGKIDFLEDDSVWNLSDTQRAMLFGYLTS